MTVAIAHRGDPVGERENTLASFLSAVRQGADMVELDLRRTRDGEIVVLHDATLTRLWGTDRLVADLDLAELRTIAQDGQRILTFPEVLGAVDVPVMVDFTETEVVDRALDIVRDMGAMARSLFVTGNVGALCRLRARAPEARIGLTSVDRESPASSLLLDLAAEFWNPWFALVTAEGVAVMHDMGIKVSTWTVDEPRQMTQVSEAGVDAIVSNQIALLRRHLSRSRPEPRPAGGVV